MKYLPHVSQENSIQFITFRTDDSVSGYLKNDFKINKLSSSKQQMEIEKYCDTSYQGCYFYDDKILILQKLLFSLDPEYYSLIAFSIMPNHVHLVIQQKKAMAEIMQKVKGCSSRLLNQALKREGRFWARDYYDKTIRDDRHLDVTYAYVRNNAVKANLKDAEHRFFGIYG
jgi:putative transposase